MDMELKYPVKSLHKALSIFEMLIHEGRDLSLTEISQGLRLEKGTVHRILATMRARKFVEQDPASKKYGLGSTSFQLGFRLNKDEILRKMMLPTLRGLCGKTRETVYAVVLDYKHLRLIARIESEEILRMSFNEGCRLPASCAAPGKILLSALSDEELRRMYGGKGSFERLTKNSIGSFKGLMEAMREARLNHVAYDDDEVVVGSCCIATPITNGSKKILAAIAVAGPKERMTDGKKAEVRRLLLDASEKISREIPGDLI